MLGGVGHAWSGRSAIQDRLDTFILVIVGDGSKLIIRSRLTLGMVLVLLPTAKNVIFREAH